MEFQRRPSAVSQLSYSDSELNVIDHSDGEACFLADLHSHSHFFTSPSNPRYSTPLILISPENSVHNSTSSIPSSLATMATGSSQYSGEASPPSSSSSSKKPKKFSLNLNGHLSPTLGHSTPTSPYLTPLGSQDTIVQQENTGVHCGDQYTNKERLALDLTALSSMPELCDVTFLVGEDRQPVCGVRAILAARSR